MACEQWLAQLDPYLDGELPAAQMRTLDSHLRTCPACAADALARVEMKRAVKSAGTRYRPSSELRNLIQKRIAGRRRSGWNFAWQTVAGVLALALVAGALAAYLGGVNFRQQQMYGELADLHVATLASTNPVDVVSTDRHTVKPWFQGKIPFTFNLPDLQNTEFTLVGGRVTYLGQVPGAHLIYQIRKHQISVFIFPEDMVRLSSKSTVSKERTFNVDSWMQDGLRYIVLGDVAAEDIRNLSELLKHAAKS